MGKKWEAMDAIFKPRAVAVVGASDNPGKLGSHVMRSLTEGGYPGRIYPVNPGKNEIMGIKTYPSLNHIPEAVDLSIIVLPAEQVPKTVMECGEKGVKGIVLITAGFREIEDRRGEALQSEVAKLANQFGIKVIGPNTFGVVNLHLPINASFTPHFIGRWRLTTPSTSTDQCLFYAGIFPGGKRRDRSRQPERGNVSSHGFCINEEQHRIQQNHRSGESV